MELYVTNIETKATHFDLIKEFSLILHSSQFSSSNLINFHVNMWRTPNLKFPNKSKIAPSHAKLTIPNQDFASRFLSRYGVNGAERIVVRGRPLKIVLSRSKPKPELIQRLNNTRFQDPEEQKRIRKRYEELNDPIQITSISFGRITSDDNIFSPEYSQALTNGIVQFDGEKRVLNVRLVRTGESLSISIRFSTIISMISIQTQDKSPSILLNLSTAPTFELLDRGRPAFLEPHTDFELYFQDLNEETPIPRERCSFLDSDHATVAPFTSNQLLLRFPSLSTFNQFRRRRTKVYLPLVRKQKMRIERGQLYTTARLQYIDSFLATLDIRIAFQIEILLHNQILDPKQICDILDDVRKLESKVGIYKFEKVLSVFAERCVQSDLEKGGYDDPYFDVNWDAEEEEEENLKPFEHIQTGPTPSSYQSKSDLLDLLYDTVKHVQLSSSLRFVEDQSSVCRHVVITPTGMKLEGPFPDVSNSVLRKYRAAENFLRVSIRDEDFGTLDRNRYLPILTSEGLRLGGRRFEFLGYSSSALKGHSTWFLSPFIHNNQLLTGEIIRNDLGDFSKTIHIAARYMARLAQAFSATLPSITLRPEQIKMIDDIKVEKNGVVSYFTDGVGTMSPDLAKEIHEVLVATGSSKNRKKKVKPTCYQIRIGGAKGMISCNSTLKGSLLCLRPSMVKFEGASLTLDVATSFNKPLPCYLNRPLIKILEDLKIDPVHFLRLQGEAVRDVESSRESLQGAATLLDRNGLGTSSHLSTTLRLIRRLLGIDLNSINDSFLDASVAIAVTHVLKQIKFKARIPLKGCYNLVGIADESNYLEEKEIYVAIKRQGAKTIYLEGPICISKSPSIHPGDVQIVYAVGKLPEGVALEMRDNINCVVFSTRGSVRSTPSCLSNADLDGDLFTLITIPELIPLHKNLSQAAVGGLAKMNVLNRPCTIDDGAQFFLDYILTDMMGIVASQHLATADRSSLGVYDPDCLKLAQLYSAAVDFPKSGTPVAFSQMPSAVRQSKPDFMCPEHLYGKHEDDGYFHRSEKVLGQLFRSIPVEDLEIPSTDSTQFCIDQNRAITRALTNLEIDGVDGSSLGIPDLALVQLFKLELEDFGEQLKRVCRLNTLSKRLDRHLSEEEAFIGTILAVTKDKHRKQEAIARLQEQTKSLLEELRDYIAGEELELEELVLRAWAAWNAGIKSDQREFGVKTFCWISLGVLLNLIGESNGEI